MQPPAGRRAAPAFDLRRPKGYTASTPAKTEDPAPAPAEEAGDPCPRCESRDTKFCYYNNYNTSQPRHYCKSCRRYWTKGGSLRDVPVGGRCRKPSSSSAAARKKPKHSKRRRVAPGPETEPSTDAPTVAAAAAPDDAATPEAATTTGAAEEPTAPPCAAADGGLADPSVTLGLRLADAGAKEPPDTSPFEWPSGCDLESSFWATGVFADPDPALFLNLQGSQS